MSETPSAEKDAHLVVSRRGIAHVVWSLEDDAATTCGKSSRDLVRVGSVGIGERMCHSCATVLPPTGGPDA